MREGVQIRGRRVRVREGVQIRGRRVRVTEERKILRKSGGGTEIEAYEYCSLKLQASYH